MIDSFLRRALSPLVTLREGAAIVGLLMFVYSFLARTGQVWVPAAFFFFGRLILGIFLISQFWTLANEIYDPRQAKRVFGFIGGGGMLRGVVGSGFPPLFVAGAATPRPL